MPNITILAIALMKNNRLFFNSSGFSLAFEAMLDEMRKFNVVQKVQTRYILRTPNIAMMMGERESIAHQLDKPAREKAEEHLNHGDQRVQLLKGVSAASSSAFPYQRCADSWNLLTESCLSSPSVPQAG